MYCKQVTSFPDDAVVQEFLLLDACCRVADNYLIAMVLAYFKRAHLRASDYTRSNFFTAL